MTLPSWNDTPTKKVILDFMTSTGDKNSPDMDVQGNILDHEYEIKEGRHKVAQVSKKWFRVRDTYGVEIAPDQEDVVILAITVALDNMAHARK